MNNSKLLLTTLQMQKKITERRINALNELPLSETTNALIAIELATLEVVIEEQQQAARDKEYEALVKRNKEERKERALFEELKARYESEAELEKAKSRKPESWIL